MIKKRPKNTEPVLLNIRTKKNMIKGGTLRKTPPRKVSIKAPSVSKDKVSRRSTVEPIMGNGLVVGVYHHCQCGENTEIRFEFEKPIPEEIIKS